MILKTKQTFDKVMLDCENSSEFLKFVIQQSEQELVSKLIDELQDHKIHIVKLGRPWTEDDPKWLQISYRQILDNDILVQCRNCKYNPDKPHKYYDNDLIYSYIWCPKFIEDLNGKGFCPYGKEIEDE